MNMKNNDSEKSVKPDYETCVDIVTKANIKEMLVKGLILPFLSPILIFILFLLMRYLYQLHPIMPAPLVLGITSLTAFSSIRLIQKDLVIWSIVLFTIHLVIIILCFGYIYQLSNGILCSNGEGCDITKFDYYYFSLVTWTTLGYGDFHPANELKFVATF